MNTQPSPFPVAAIEALHKLLDDYRLYTRSEPVNATTGVRFQGEFAGVLRVIAGSEIPDFHLNLNQAVRRAGQELGSHASAELVRSALDNIESERQRHTSPPLAQGFSPVERTPELVAEDRGAGC